MCFEWLYNDDYDIMHLRVYKCWIMNTPYSHDYLPIIFLRVETFDVVSEITIK